MSVTSSLPPDTQQVGPFVELTIALDDLERIPPRPCAQEIPTPLSLYAYMHLGPCF